jgi:hypothetical protein
MEIGSTSICHAFLLLSVVGDAGQILRIEAPQQGEKYGGRYVFWYVF